MTKLYVFLLVLLSSMANAQDYNGVPSNLFSKIGKETESKIILGGYMWSKDANASVQCIDSTNSLDGWEGRKLYVYDYKVPGETYTRGLRGRVILYNASADKIVKWIVNALIKCNIKPTYHNITIVINYIGGQSNFQFPVRGIVYEDLDTSKDKKTGKSRKGFNETYVFFDGVTVERCDFQISSSKFERVDSVQEAKYFNMKYEDVCDTLPHYPKGKGRISSTMRDEYKKLFAAETYGKSWTQIVRKEYQKAMDSDFNNLIYCTVCSDLPKVKSIYSNKEKKMINNPEKKFLFE